MVKYNDRITESATDALGAVRIIFKIVTELALLHPEVWDKVKEDPEIIRYLGVVKGNKDV